MKKLALLAAAALLTAVPLSLAQEGLGVGGQDETAKKELPRPPIARKADPKPPHMWNMLAVIVIVGAVFGANMIPSKRGHQD